MYSILEGINHTVNVAVFRSVSLFRFTLKSYLQGTGGEGHGYLTVRGQRAKMSSNLRSGEPL